MYKISFIWALAFRSCIQQCNSTCSSDPAYFSAAKVLYRVSQTKTLIKETGNYYRMVGPHSADCDIIVHHPIV